MLDTSQIQMIFFDAGNVFVSDDPSGCFAYECLFQYINQRLSPISVEEFFRLRTEHAQNGGGLWSLVGKYVPKADFKQWQLDVRARMYKQWSHLSPPIAAMQDVPRLLSKEYRLGILANQPAEMEDVLAERGLLQYFEILAISDKLELYKPDPRLYQWAVDASGLPASATLMVGDRIDNDIIPAKSIGMKTAWLRLGYARRDWLPETDFQRHYAESICAASYSECEPETETATPDAVFTSADELLTGLLPKS